jgi:hypothetical protein
MSKNRKTDNIPEIEVTPDMVEAGVDILIYRDINMDDPARIVREVIKASLEAAPLRKRIYSVVFPE